VTDAGATGSRLRSRGQPEGHRLRGFSEVGAGALINGAIGVVVTWATMPVVMLVGLRMVFAAAALGLVVALRHDWPSIGDRRVALRLLLAGLTLAANLSLYFVAIRETGVAVAIFTSYLAPVYVAFLGPHFEGGRTEGVVYGALVAALGGMALILVPGLAGDGARHSAGGLAAGVAAGVFYALYLLQTKQLRRRGLHSTSIVFSLCVVTAVVLVPLGLWRTPAADFTARNLLLAALLGLVMTALSFSLFLDGMHYVKVQHASIMGYIEPVSAPLFALVFLGQRPSVWTVAGGALIIAAGVLVIVFGAPEPAPAVEEGASARPLFSGVAGQRMPP
jgi:DME family drug/metabolite transporter